MLYKKPEPGMPCVLTIGGREVELKFTLRVLRELHTNENIQILNGEWMRHALQDPQTLSRMLCYGLRTKNPDITEAWVEDNVDASMLIDLAPALAYATTGRWPDMSRILGETDAAPNESRPNGLPQTGLPSGPSGATISD
jgi:hypothetical protein